MYENQEILNIDVNALVDKVNSLNQEGYRMVQICCTTLEDHFQVDYSFDNALKFLGLRIKLPRENAELPSVSSIYLEACLYENELHDLFGIKVNGMAIDFGGKFYRIEKKNPFSSDDINIVKKD